MAEAVTVDDTVCCIGGVAGGGVRGVDVDVLVFEVEEVVVVVVVGVVVGNADVDWT